MKKTTKIHLVLIPISIFVPFFSYYLSSPWDKVYFSLFIGSFLCCSFVGWSAMIRSRKRGLLSFNPLTQVKAASEVSLNGIEKVILLYSIFIFAGCFLGLMFSIVVYDLA